MKKHLSEGQKEIVNYIIDGIIDVNDAQPNSTFTTEELLHELCNADYFIVGYYPAEQFLIRWGGVFKAIGEVMDSDKEVFGQLATDFSSSEDVANKLAYIEGERFLNECPTFARAHHSGRLDNDALLAIIEELESL